MPRVYWLSFHQLRRRTRRCTALYTGRARTVFWSLFYNDMCGWYSILDVVLEPWYRFADGYIGYIGPVFTAFLISMMVIVIFLCYVIVVPYEWVRMSYLQIAAYLLTGHWLLVMTWFHYGLAWRVKAGSPRAAKSVGEYAEAASFCKHCIAPKPPRTHHCRICGRCVLKMDHHCPWLSQCVGHYNHRYFFLSMVYMCLGCLYICVGSFSCFHEHFYNERDIAPWCSVLYNSLPYAPYLCSLSDSPRLLRENILSSNESTGEVYLLYGVAASNSVQFIFIVSAAMVVGLFGLTAWHAMLISQGQTSIEQHINDGMERKMRREGKVFRNIYNLGFKINWQVFLGLDTPGRSAWRTLLLPVRVPPSGDGYSLISFMPYSYRMANRPPVPAAHRNDNVQYMFDDIR